jgi:parallel beta-helix repeat protein
MISGGSYTISQNKVYNATTSGIYATGTNVIINQNEVYNNPDTGIYVPNTSWAVVTDNNVHDNTKYGIRFLGSSVSIAGQCEGNTIKANGIYGIYGQSSVTGMTMNNNIITNNVSWGIYFDTAGSDFYPMHGNTVTGNGGSLTIPMGLFPDESNVLTPNTLKKIVIQGSQINAHTTMPIWAAGTNDEVHTYEVNGTINVTAYKKLTINAGVVLKFSSGSITVNGALMANGSESRPIFFTSLKDDFIDGDTNGDTYTTSPQNGDWSTITFSNSFIENLSRLSYAVVRYGGGVNISQADIEVSNCTITNSSGYGIRVYQAKANITGNNIWGNATDGIYVQDCPQFPITFNTISTNMSDGISVTSTTTPLVNNNQIFMNREYGINNLSTSYVIDAQKNWWGDSNASGPYQATTNVNGKGNAVTAGVNYSNYNLIVPLPFSYYDPAVTPGSYGPMAVPVLKQGAASDEWDPSQKRPYYTMVYAGNAQSNEVVLAYSGLNPNEKYQFRVTYYNKDSAGGIQQLKASSGTFGVDEVMFSDPIHTPFTMPGTNPTQYEWAIPTSYYADGKINLHFVLFDPSKTFRAVVEEVWLMVKVKDFTPPRFTAVDFNDLDGSGTLSVGDEYSFTFSEELKTSVIQNNSTDANIQLSPAGKKYGDINTVRWSTGGEVCIVTVTSGFTITGNELVDPSDAVVDLFGNIVAGTQNLKVTDSIAPIFSAIEYVDIDGDGLLSLGDTYTFVFNEAMKSSVINHGTTDANFHLRPAGGRTYGTSNTVAWSSDKTRVTVTITNGFTVIGNELVTPSSSVTDLSNNQVKGTQYLSGNLNTAPAKPVILSAKSLGKSLKIDWAANSESDLAGYLLTYGTSSGSYSTEIDVGNVVSYTTPNIPAATYYISLRAYDWASQRSPYADEVVVVVTGDTTAPDPIINLVASAGDRIVDLSWNATSAPDLAHYNIYVGIETYNSVSDLTPYASANSNSYQVTGLTNGVTYWFAVTAVDDSGNENPNVTAVSATPHGQITGAQAYWPLNEGSGPTTADASGNSYHGTLRGRSAWSVEVPCVQGYCCVAQNHSVYFDGKECIQPPAVSVSPRSNCASSYSAANPIRVNLPAAGDYVITSTGGAATVWDDQHAWFYRLLVTIQSTGQTITMGRSDQYSSQAAAAAANLGISLSIHVDAPDSLFFWFSDSVCTDNHGSLQAEVTGAAFVQNPALVDGSLNIPLSNTISLLAWFKAVPSQFGQGSPNIVAVESNQNSARTHGIFFDPDGSIRAWATCSGGGQTGVIDTGSTHYNDGQWHQAVYTFDGSNGRFYLDGQLRQTASGSCSNMEDVQYFMLGRCFSGNVDDARIYNRILSADEISDNYKQCTGGPLAYWKFNEGVKDLITDVTGNNNNGTRQGTAAWVDSTIDTTFENYLPTDYALKLDGSDDLVTVGDKLDMTGGNFSVEVWVMKSSDSTASMRIVNKGMHSSGNPANTGYRLRYINNKLEFAVQGEYQGLLIQIPEPSINEWHQIVGVLWQNHEGKLYVDGDLKGSAVLDGLTGDMSSDLPLSFGAMDIGSSTLDYLQGQIDEISIYDRALTDEEVMRHYWIFSWGVVGRWKFDEGSGTVAVDSSKQANHGSISAGSWSDSVLQNYGFSTGNSLMLNGSSTMVEIPDSVTLQTYYVSLEAWVKPVANSGQHTAILSRENEWYMQIGNETGNGENHFEVAIKPSYSLLDGGAITPNVWTHLMAVWDGNTVRFYINGVRVKAYNATRGWITPTHNPIRIGNRWDTDAYFYGQLDEVAVYNRPLGDREVDHRAKYGQMLGWPVAVISAPLTDGNYAVNSDISFDGTPSYDPNGNGLVSYFWSFGDKGGYTSSSPSTTHRYTAPGVYPVNLAVQDGQGWSAGQTIFIVVK